MRLAAIYNVWNDWDLLEHSVKNIAPLLDDINDVIIVGSDYSNYGEFSQTPREWMRREVVHHYEPKFSHPVHSETDKRNFGLQKASELGYTHFIMMDADEFYDPEEFLREKERFHVKPDLAGLVCRTQVYVKSPTLTIGYDTTLVPFIHKITPTLKHEFNRNYPFAWEGKNIRIDPTRSLNINSGVEW